MKIEHPFQLPDLVFRPNFSICGLVLVQDLFHEPLGPGDFVPLDALQSAFLVNTVDPEPGLVRARRWFILASLHQVHGGKRWSRIWARFNARPGARAWMPPDAGFVPAGPWAMPGQAWAKPGQGPGQAWVQAWGLGDW